MALTHRGILCDEIRVLSSRHGSSPADGSAFLERTWEARHVGDLEFHYRSSGMQGPLGLHMDLMLHISL